VKKLNIATLAAVIALAVSTSAMAAPEAAWDASKAAPTSTKESAGEYVDDSVITSKVKALIFEDASLKSAEINVETYKGTVQLTGFVKSRAAIRKAAKIARSVKGVKSVKNDMIVKGKH
jgi:hyperosmotically inducible protein